MSGQVLQEASLILAAEDCEPSAFDSLHKFPSQNDQRIIRTLLAHGPVLLRGGRGSGKSAFMIAAAKRLSLGAADAPAIGIYMSLRHAPLLKSSGDAYEKILCEIIIRSVKDALGTAVGDFSPSKDVGSLQYELSNLAERLGKRLVLFFDDAAHLGREASLEDFFDIYRTLSGSAVSCKAAIYPGVTKFGVRFDVYNDATVIDLLRSEEFPEFNETFLGVMDARYPSDFDGVFSGGLDKKLVAGFLAQSVLGNMRGFVFACNKLKERAAGSSKVGLSELNETLIDLAANYYWPLLQEIKPKLGMYEPMVSVAQDVAEILFSEVGEKTANPRDMIVHRDIDERLAKPLQILEYAGFLSKREASRAMKSGGRGARYALNLCSLLEQTSGSRLTRELFDKWCQRSREEAVQFGRSSLLGNIKVPATPDTEDLAILNEPLETLLKSKLYPYGLSQQRIDALKDSGFISVGDLAMATDDELDSIPYFGEVSITRVRNVVGQAIWM
ncbi:MULTISPECIES: ATP-binding protein [Xanthomonas]|uniref:ATP-binding protein n=1 Tax=Xanthomonas TaxID=338 RepID=UPI0011B0B920|nr:MULTISPECIES: ATP-binding protein [Xanthomonas]MCC4606240.1 ATP-binding protein [Xanthomonas campestris pv. parthenii]